MSKRAKSMGKAGAPIVARVGDIVAAGAGVGLANVQAGAPVVDEAGGVAGWDRSESESELSGLGRVDGVGLAFRPAGGVRWTEPEESER